MTAEAEITVTQLQAKYHPGWGHNQELGEGGRIPPRAGLGAWPRPHLDLGLVASRPERRHFCRLASWFMALCEGSSGNGSQDRTQTPCFLPQSDFPTFLSPPLDTSLRFPEMSVAPTYSRALILGFSGPVPSSPSGVYFQKALCVPMWSHISISRAVPLQPVGTT